MPEARLDLAIIKPRVRVAYYKGDWETYQALTNLITHLAAALARISELEDQCIGLGDKVLYMLPVVDAVRTWARVITTPETEEYIEAEHALHATLAALDALPYAPQPRQPAATDSDAVPDVQPVEPA